MKTYIETYQIYFIQNFNDLKVIIETVRAGFGSWAQKVEGFKSKEPNTRNFKRVDWKLGFDELNNANNEFKIEIKQGKTDFVWRNPSSTKSEESSSWVYST